MNKQTGILLSGVGAAGILAWNVIRRRSWLDLHGKIVLITGGSRGLGFQLAREFGSRGATAAICARDESELDRAKQDLTQRGIRAYTVRCDVTNRDEVDSMVEQVTRNAGPIDVLVNDAGIIRVGPYLQQTVQDFEDAMDVMFWGPLYCTYAVLPHMRRRKTGRIVNITSIGAKVSIPHLVPYSCAKFAFIALSEGLGTELAPEGIRVTTIVPGLMRTGSHIKAELKGNHTGEYVWFSAGAATPFVSISAERAARTIVRATIRGDRERILSLPAHILARLHGLFPQLTMGILELVNRFVLPGAPEHQTGTRTGEEARRQLNSRILELINRPGQKAAESLNEVAQPAR